MSAIGGLMDCVVLRSMALSVLLALGMLLGVGGVERAFAQEPELQSAGPQMTQEEDAADFYAVLHEDGTLVFQAECPNQQGLTVFSGTLDGYGSAELVPWHAASDVATSVRFAEDFAQLKPTSCAYWFFGMSKLESVDLAHLDFSASESMRQLFKGCSSLASIEGLDQLDTSSCGYFGGAFCDCASLTSLDLSHFDTSQAWIICEMFYGCTNLRELDLSGAGWDLPLLRLSVLVWEGCENLQTVKLGPNFTFIGTKGTRQFVLPEGNWRSSVDGQVYASAEVPCKVAATYTRVPADEGSSEDGGADNPADGDGTDVNPSNPSVTEPTAPAADNPTKRKPAAKGIAVGKTAKVAGATYKVTSNAKATVRFAKAPKSKTNVVIPATVTVKGKKYAVIGIAKGAFKGTKAKTVVVKTKRLAKARVRGCFKGAKRLKVVKVPKVKRAAYRALFKKAVCGARVTVRA